MSAIPRQYEIEASSGAYVNLREPDPSTIRLRDVADGLSRTCRFAGHGRAFYSVAQHAVLVARKLEREGHGELALAGLHHDDAEAYLGDVPRPLKLLLDELAPGVLRGLESRMDAAIYSALSGGAGWAWDLGDYHHDLVKAADAWALLTEARHLLPSRGRGWSEDGLGQAWELRIPWPVEAWPWSGTWTPGAAAGIWLACHRELVGRARRRVA